MPVFITSALGLQNVYGASNYNAVNAAVCALVAASPGGVLRVLDDPVNMQDGAAATARDANSLRAALQSCCAAVGPPDGIVIIGDQRVIPSFTVANPVTDRSIDPDPVVATDNPYGFMLPVSPPACLVPPIPVGRIVAGIDATANDFCAMLALQSLLRRQRPLRSGYVEIASWQWQDASRIVLSRPGTERVFISPDSVLNSSNAANLDCQFLYCNLHGFVDQPAWMGYDPALGFPVTAITPDAFQSQYVSGTIAFTEACYGLLTDGKKTSGSCALSLLASGAAAVVGSTGLAFGTATLASQHLIDADALAQAFFTVAIQPGATVGSCLRAAREALSQSVSVDPYVAKTLLEFQLLGDPTYVIS